MKRISLLTLAFALLFVISGCENGEQIGNTEDFEGAPGATAGGGEAPEIVAGTYELDDSHSEVGFRVRHLGIANVRGRFDDVDGQVTFASNDLSSMTVQATIQATSINTRNDRRDNHLRSADFFDAENHPTLTFESTSVTPLDGGRFRMNGNLTIRGNTRPVTLEGEYLGTQAMPNGRRKIAISAEGTINRKDFGLEWDRLVEGAQTVGDNITLELEAEADLVQPEAEAANGQ